MPLMWSLCSWVMSTADSSLGSNPNAFSPVVMRRADTPASMRICVFPSDTTEQFPEEPLATVANFNTFLPPYTKKRQPLDGTAAVHTKDLMT